MANLKLEYEQTRAGAGLFDISARAKVQVVGPDAGKFLHNLSTNDINRLAANSGCEAFLATAQARLVAYVLIYHTPAQNGADFWLDADPGMAGKVAQHLDRYLISEQLEIKDRTAEFCQFHLAGPKADAVLAAAAGEVVPELAELQHRAMQLAGTTCYVRRHSPLGLPGYDLVGPADRAEEVRQALLQSGAAEASPEAYEVLRVEGGTPVYGVDLDDTRLVMDVGRMQAVSYTKGCYLGQEPIVMARDRGHANRALLGLMLAEGVVPRGAKLLLDGKDVGQVTSPVLSPRLGAIALGYVRRGSQQPGTILEVEAGGRAKVAPLPFLADIS